MAGYIRQSSFSDGDTITAALFNNEYNQILNAFSNTSGHAHDGTAAEGPVIGLIGDAGETAPNNKVLIDTTNNYIEFYVQVSSSPVQQLYIADGAIVPVTDNDIDLGTSSLEFKDGYFDGTLYADAINFNGTAITATAAELNILDGVTATATELNLIDGVTATTAELNILDGVTSTAAELNILDVSGSTIGDLAEISTIASDDVFLALDTSGGGIKKVARSTLVSGLATSSAISNLSEDTSPQLGGNLDMNGADIVTTSNATIDLAPNGTGTVVVRGNTNSGAIVFNCESNSHGQTVIAQPHSASVTNTMLLPAGASSTLVSLVSTDTLTNKTLTTPVLTTPIANAGVQLKNGATSAGFLEFFEDSDNGSNKVTLIGPASTADITLTLPSTAGTVSTEEAAVIIAQDEATALAIALG